MTDTYTFADIAEDYALWQEFVPSRPLSEDDFEAMDYLDKIAIQVDAFGTSAASLVHLVKYELCSAPEIDSLLSAAGTWRIDTDDSEPDDCNCDGETLWVTSTHTLYCDDTAVAQWSRCAAGNWGGNGAAPNEWTISEDTNAGHALPEYVADILRVVNLDDTLPDVPEPPKASQIHSPDPDGDFAVWWETIDSNESVVVERYATRDAATAIAAEKNRDLTSKHRGHLLCSYRVAELDSWGEWNLLPTD